jgi:hypothetical protein
VVLKAERNHILHGGGSYIDDGKRIVFLKCDIRLCGIRGDRNVFRLQVLRDGGARAKDPHVRIDVAIKGRERGGLNVGLPQLLDIPQTNRNRNDAGWRYRRGGR